MAGWRPDPKRRGKFVAGHARLQRWIFRLEIGRHQDEGVMVPVGVWRCARPPIGVLFHRALAADKFLRLLAAIRLSGSDEVTPDPNRSKRTLPNRHGGNLKEARGSNEVAWLGVKRHHECFKVAWDVR